MWTTKKIYIVILKSPKLAINSSQFKAWRVHYTLHMGLCLCFEKFYCYVLADSSGTMEWSSVSILSLWSACGNILESV